MDAFHFDLPPELIAQTPASPRDHARLLVYDRRSHRLTDKHFYDLPELLQPQTTLVLNNSRVEKCRLQFGKLEVFVLETVNPTTVRAMVRPGKKFGLGKQLALAPGLEAEVTAIDDEGLRTLRFNQLVDGAWFDEYRHTPFPPYIAADETLSAEYQTVFAKQDGSKAAPTAGLHFTTTLLDTIRQQHKIAEITLDVGLGTFAPLKEEQLRAGRLHAEEFTISADTAHQLNQASDLTAVGTTTVRCLESAFHGSFTSTRQSTDIFIQPGYQFKIVDHMITNFHLPGTSLLMMVEAFLGSRQALETLYRHAISERYRFYSFGDAMLIL